LHVKANMSLGKKKKKKKESKETIPVNIYWRFFNRTWLVLMCSCFYLLWGDQIKEWSIYIYIYIYIDEKASLTTFHQSINHNDGM
jgi:hypothetical protein